MNEITSSLKELPKITEYKKGETKTSDLVPTTKVLLGRGAFGDVFIHRNNPDLVVKKTRTSQISDFTIAKRLDHPNIVKIHQLFVKCYPQGPKKYKLVMDRIYGEHLCKSYGAKLPPETILGLMRQAKDCCLYLYDQGIHWADMHGENTYYDKIAQKLIVADFGFWSQTATPERTASHNIGEARRLLRNILAASTLPGIPKARSIDASITKEIETITATNGKREDAYFKGKTSQETHAIIEGYFDEVMQKFIQATSLPPSLG
jgi:serine/threonine protein kinase